MPLYIVILINERDIPDAAAIVRNKLTIARWSLIPRIGCQHALDTHADTFYRLDWRPAG